MSERADWRTLTADKSTRPFCAPPWSPVYTVAACHFWPAAERECEELRGEVERLHALLVGTNAVIDGLIEGAT